MSIYELLAQAHEDLGSAVWTRESESLYTGKGLRFRFTVAWEDERVEACAIDVEKVTIIHLTPALAKRAKTAALAGRVQA